MSGLVNSSEEVLNALDLRMEPKFVSDIIPVGKQLKHYKSARQSSR